MNINNQPQFSNNVFYSKLNAVLTKYIVDRRINKVHYIDEYISHCFVII